MKIKKIFFLVILLVNIKLLCTIESQESNESKRLVLIVTDHSTNHQMETGDYLVTVELVEQQRFGSQALKDFFQNKTIIAEDCFQTQYSDGSTSRVQRDQEGLYWQFNSPDGTVRRFDHHQGYQFRHEQDPVTKELKRIQE
jgi:hypothetical protein